MMPTRVVLGSQSPRRRELLAQIGIDSVVRPADIDESAIRHDDPLELAQTLARVKAATVLERIAADEPELMALPVIAADTVVAIDDTILEKPENRDDAERMIRLLSGRTHEVVTGVAILLPPEEEPAKRARTPHVQAAVSRILLARFSEEEISEYLDVGEWQGVAGAYRIQGLAARYVRHLEGSYANVVGLPLHLVYSILTGQFS